MKVTHYLYNAFLLESGGAKVAIDPGQNLWIFKLESLVPESEWPSVTHIVITHGDPDHHWQSDRVAKASGAHDSIWVTRYSFPIGKTSLQTC